MNAQEPTRLLTTTPEGNHLSLLPPEIRSEIRSEIYKHYLHDLFQTHPFKRELIYQANDAQTWNCDWRANPDVCDLPPLERALFGDIKLHREFFALRVSLSILVIRPAECADHSIFQGGSGSNSACIYEAEERKNIRYPVLGLHISPLVVRNAREIRYLTYVHNPILDDICIDKNGVSTELGKALIELGRWSDEHTPTLRLLTIVFRAPYYALYWKSYEFERTCFQPGLEVLIKKRGVQKLQLEGDDGQGWRGNGPDFGVLGESLSRQLGVNGVVELLDNCSKIKYNRVVHPHTGVSESWEGEDGKRLVWGGVGVGVEDGVGEDHNVGG